MTVPAALAARSTGPPVHSDRLVPAFLDGVPLWHCTCRHPSPRAQTQQSRRACDLPSAYEARHPHRSVSGGSSP